MQPSLSALLPVHNAQSTLQAEVSQILEVLSELTDRLELVVVDDASTDATVEVIPELAACYPQIRVAHHSRPLGRAAALRTGLARSTGDVIFFQDENCTLAINELHKLWEDVARHPIVLGRAGTSGRAKRGRRKGQREDHSGNYQFVHRPAFEQIQALLTDEATLVEILRGLGCPWLEVEVRDRAQPCGGHPAGEKPRRPWGRPARADLSQQGSSRPKRPNYLRRLKDFALGE